MGRTSSSPLLSSFPLSVEMWREKSSFTLASSVDCMTSECHLILDRNIDLFNYENFSLQFKYIARHSTY